MSAAVFVVFLLAAGVAAAQNSGGTADMACVDRLDIPKYPALAEATRIATGITVSVQLGADGAVETINSVLAPHPGKAVEFAFTKAVGDSLQSSQFFAECSGRILTFHFNFALGDQTGTQRFAFGYPNRFTILAPVKLLVP